MWPFSSQPTRQIAPPPPAENSLPTDVRAELDTLKSQMAQLQLDWSDTLEKIQRWAGRMAARERQRIHRDLDSLNAQEPVGDTNGTDPTPQPAPNAKAALRSRLAQTRRITA